MSATGRVLGDGYGGQLAAARRARARCGGRGGEERWAVHRPGGWGVTGSWCRGVVCWVQSERAARQNQTRGRGGRPGRGGGGCVRTVHVAADAGARRTAVAVQRHRAGLPRTWRWLREQPVSSSSSSSKRANRRARDTPDPTRSLPPLAPSPRSPPLPTPERSSVREPPSSPAHQLARHASPARRPSETAPARCDGPNSAPEGTTPLQSGRLEHVSFFAAWTTLPWWGCSVEERQATARPNIQSPTRACERPSRHPSSISRGHATSNRRRPVAVAERRVCNPLPSRLPFVFSSSSRKYRVWPLGSSVSSVLRLFP